MSEKSRIICNLCKSEVSEQSQYCHNCGSLFEDGESCFEHPQTPALAVCTICHRPVCHHSVLYHNAAAYCIEHHPGYQRGHKGPLSTIWMGYTETVTFGIK